MPKDRYIYPAIFDYSEEAISVEFPDLPGCFTCGDTDEEAFRMAKEALALHVYGMEKDNEQIPNPSKVSNLIVEPQQAIILVEVWMPAFRDEMEQKAIKKTLTIPKWLDDLAKEKNINFSHLLQDALKKYLGIKDERPI